MDQGSTAFVLICAALVLLAAIGVPFLHGRDKADDTRHDAGLLALGAAGVMGALWVLLGDAMVFGSGSTSGFVGIDGVIGVDLDLIGLHSLLGADDGGAALATAAFQGVLAVVVAVLVALALTARRRTGLAGSLLFVAIWAVLVYFPIAGWVFNVRWGLEGVTGGGWLVHGLSAIVGAGVVDFAGGLPVHVAVGASALGIALASGRGRVPPGRRGGAPASVPQVLLGAALLWFGWLGVTAGTEGAADGFAALALLNTLVTPAAALLAWILVEVARHGKATATGAAWGSLSGLVAVTAGAAYLGPVWSLLLGAATAVLCFFAVELLSRRLRAITARLVGIHLVGGILSLIYLGFFATGDGFIYAGTPPQLIAQVVSVIAVVLYAGAVSFLLMRAVIRADGLAVSVRRGRIASRS